MVINKTMKLPDFRGLTFEMERLVRNNNSNKKKQNKTNLKCRSSMDGDKCYERNIQSDDKE